MVYVPRSIAAYQDLAASFVAIIDEVKTLAGDSDGLTLLETRAVLVRSAGVFVEIVRGYTAMSGEQKKALVDATLAELLRQLKPHLIKSANTIVAVALPWYLKPLPWLLSFFVKIDVIERLAGEIPVLSQAAYDGLLYVWSRLGVPRK
jgi:hypothetical protein